MSIQRGWTARYAFVLIVSFTLLYLLTRSSIPIADSELFISLAREGNPAELHYAEPSHFLQIPLVRGLWTLLTAIGLPIPVEAVFLTICLAGTIAASIFLGLIAAELLKTEAAAWLAAVLFGTSLHAWTQWNGELYALGLGLVTAGLFLALRGQLLTSAFLWAFSVLSHSEFALAAPAFVMAVWLTRRASDTTREKMRRAFALLALGGTTTVLVLIAGAWLVGSWHDAPSFIAWLSRSYSTREVDVAATPEVVRAARGLITAHTVAGHYWRDILTGRGAYDHPLFIPASAIGFLVLAATGLFVAAAVSHRRLMLLGLLWLLPVHLLVNWWFVPTVEKYHGPALPGFSLLITGGLVYAATRLRPRGRYALYVSYVALCAGLNLFGAVLPMQALGTQTSVSERKIRELAESSRGRAVFVSCDDPRALTRAGVPFFRIRAIWIGTVTDIQQSTLAWVTTRIREGYQPYLVDRWCLPEEWVTAWSKEPFDLFFLERHFRLVPTGITAVPVAHTPLTNPFGWRRGDVFRVVTPTDAVGTSMRAESLAPP